MKKAKGYILSSRANPWPLPLNDALVGLGLVFIDGRCCLFLVFAQSISQCPTCCTYVVLATAVICYHIPRMSPSFLVGAWGRGTDKTR